MLWIGVLAALAGCGDDDASIDLSVLPPLPERISSLPEGIRVVAEQGPRAMARVGETVEAAFEWPRTLWVFTEDVPVRIVEFGRFAWTDGAWVEAHPDGKPHSGRTFAEWLRCDDAVLEPGKVYYSPGFANARDHRPIEPEIYRWYFIGETDEGLRRGAVTVVDLPQLEPPRPVDGAGDPVNR